VSLMIERLTSALNRSYRIERELGAGGMATVYLAQDLRHNRRVAVKVLRPELAAVIGAEQGRRYPDDGDRHVTRHAPPSAHHCPATL
jgi:serine/threonine protein kinase